MNKQSKKQIGIFFILLLLLSFQQSLLAQVRSEWAISMGDSIYDGGNTIKVDLAGNVYTVGIFSGTVDFDPGVGVTNLVGTTNSIFISKSDASGALIWAKAIDGTGMVYEKTTEIDAVGNIYITGFFQGTIDLDPSAGVASLTSLDMAMFVCKLDASGTLVWAKNIVYFASDFSPKMTTDALGNIYLLGTFRDTLHFDPNAGITNLFSTGLLDIFILKLDISGTLLWAKSIGGSNYNQGHAISVDGAGNIYTTGWFQDTVDFDPDTAIYNLISNNGGPDIFISKLDASGAFVWAKSISSPYLERTKNIITDATGNIFISGSFSQTVDFDPDAGVTNLSSTGGYDFFVCKLDASGTLLWAKKMGGIEQDISPVHIATDSDGNLYATAAVEYSTNNFPFIPYQDVLIFKFDAFGNLVWKKTIGERQSANWPSSIAIDDNHHIYITGTFSMTTDFDPSAGVINLTSAQHYDVFILKLIQSGIVGAVYQDFNQNCVRESIEGGLTGRNLLLQPGNIIVQTDNDGVWVLDTLTPGNYTITVDTPSTWLPTCPIVQNFTVAHPDSITTVPSFGFVSTIACSSPNLSIFAPILRPGFSNQRVYVQACNTILATALLDSAFVVVELDSMLTVQSSSTPYTDLGNNRYRIDLDSLYPDVCENFWLDCHLSTNAILGQTLCMNVRLYPIEDCALDAIPNPSPAGFTPCNTPYDFSHLVIRPECHLGDSTIRFEIENIGSGSMTCLSQLRLYINGILSDIDSLQIAAGASALYVIPADARTWRLEIDQHPLHPGNSQPSATIENCGAGTWTPNLVNILPHDDADPNIDIYCGVVSGSFDPNDKTGYPLGIGNTHDILPNQEMEYVIRFQNTGTDTAFTVVVRDTLSEDLDILTVASGVSSHDYSFTMHGPRILEWTFNNIMLPDSNVNEAASHGFLKFKVQQKANLLEGTIVENSAAIYFDFNAPVITNTSWHTIRNLSFSTINVQKIEQPSLQINIYPNPTTGFLHIDQKGNSDISIYVLDNLGRVVMAQQSNDIITDLNISHLPTGVYYININNGRELVTKKVVKM